jgi:hypothetical protein
VVRDVFAGVVTGAAKGAVEGAVEAGSSAAGKTQPAVVATRDKGNKSKTKAAKA